MPSFDDKLLEPLTQWVTAHAAWLSWLAVGSVVMLLATPVLLPAWIASLPDDYFVQPRRLPRGAKGWLRRALAWVLGTLLLVAGLLMLFLPGQGLLTLFAGLSLLPFPGKPALLRRVLGHRKVADALQWMRRRAGRPPLVLPGSDAS